MMNLAGLLAFVVVMAALAAMPSASVLLVVTRSVTHGFRSGAAVTAGIVAGDLVFVALALGGMTLLAETAGGLFAVLRWAAGGYLAWLGIRLILSAPGAIGPCPQTSNGVSNVASFAAGLFLTLGDVKAILFYASLFPAFVDLRSVSLFEVIVIAAVTVTTVGSVKLTYAALAHRLSSRLTTLWAGRAPRVFAGSLLTGAGIYLVSQS